MVRWVIRMQEGGRAVLTFRRVFFVVGEKETKKPGEGVQN